MATRSSRSGSSSSARFAADPSMRIIVLQGKDAFQIAARTREIAEVLRKAHGEIEQFSFDGGEATVAEVLDELRSYGLIQRHKLVILDKAETFLSEKGPSGDRARPAMERYAASPMPEATLVMRAENWRAGKIDRLIAKVGGVFKLEPPTAAKAVSWCMKRCDKEYATTIEPAAAERLVALIGPDLARLDTELSKLAAYVGQDQQITATAVAELVGLTREEEVWAIQSALASGDAGRTLMLLHELLNVACRPPELVTWAICDALRKLHGAAQLFREGVPGGAIRGRMKLFGGSADPLLATARQGDPVTFARLLDRAIRTDHGNKSGLGEPTRSLEVLTVVLADGIHQQERYRG